MSTLPPPLPSGYTFSRDPAITLSYLQEIYDGLTGHPNIYWGKARTKDVIKLQVERAWSCIVLLKEKEGEDRKDLVGFARVVGDGYEFAYLCDVFVLPGHEKQGLANIMVHEVIENTDGEGVSTGWKWFLWTRDAHGVYEKAAGFKTLPTNGWGMERMPPGADTPV